MLSWGGNGDDIKSGSPGDDRLFDNGGADQLYGWNGDDRMSGGNGDDWLYGGAVEIDIDGDLNPDPFRIQVDLPEPTPRHSFCKSSVGDSPTRLTRNTAPPMSASGDIPLATPASSRCEPPASLARPII